MKEKKIVIISPKFYPLKDGLGGYTTKFVKHLSLRAEVHVITSAGLGVDFNYPNIAVHPIVQNWKRWGLRPICKEIKRIAPDRVLFQYVPFMYGRGGINFSFPLLIIWLRFWMGLRIDGMIHELFYPLKWSFKELFMHFSHRFMLYILGFGTHQFFVSTTRFKQELSKILFWKKNHISQLSVGCNIDNYHPRQDELAEFRQKYLIEENGLLVGLFGLLHPSKNYPLVIEEVYKLWKKNNKLKILFVGQTLKDLASIVNGDLRDDLNKFVIATGPLEDKDVAIGFHLMDILISYFVDGMSTRRGSALAALQFGTPIITTKTEHTEYLFEDIEGIKLLDSAELDFKQMLGRELSNLRKKEEEVCKGLVSFYQQHFSWENVIDQYNKYW